MGGPEACQQIPTETNVHTQQLTTENGEEQFGFIFNEENIQREAAAEVREIFEMNKNPLFQAYNNFVALWAENIETNECVIA